MTQFSSFFATRSKGLLVAILIAVAASFLSEHYGGPAMLFALLIGMSMNFLAHEPATKDGIGFASRDVLRVGVALLGLRIAFSDIAHLGISTLIAIPVLIAVTVLSGMVLGRFAGRSWQYGALTGGAVAICGASAALAIAAMLPRSKVSEQDTLLTVVGVTILSTLAMIAYPVLFGALGLSDTHAGLLIGATIHDVAQVVGAGYSISDHAGEVATVVKLLRVAMLPLLLIVLTLSIQERDQAAMIRLPWFLVAFIALMVLVNLATIPAVILGFFNDASRWFLLIAVSALGVKTSLGELRVVGAAKMAVILGATLVLLVLSIAFVEFAQP